MGHLDEGVRLIREQIRRHCQHGKRNHELIFTHMLGKFYLSLVRRQTPLNLKATIKNAPFLLRSLPLSARYAERYLCRAIAIGTRIGARLRLAQAHLDLGRLYLFRKRIDDARRHVAESIALFEACGAEPLLSEARETLDQLSR
jgi:hypothetical protein